MDWLGPQKTKLIWKNTKSKVYGGRKKKQFQVAHLWEHEFLRLIFFNIVEGRVSFKRWWENCFDFSLPEMLFHKGYIIFWFAKSPSWARSFAIIFRNYPIFLTFMEYDVTLTSHAFPLPKSVGIICEFKSSTLSTLALCIRNPQVKMIYHFYVSVLKKIHLRSPLVPSDPRKKIVYSSKRKMTDMWQCVYCVLTIIDFWFRPNSLAPLNKTLTEP